MDFLSAISAIFASLRRVSPCTRLSDDEDKRRILKDPSIVTRPQSLCKKCYDRVRGYDQETKMQYLDINLWMVGDILLKADRRCV